MEERSFKITRDKEELDELWDFIESIRHDMSNKEIPSFVYFIFNERANAFKIGRSTNVAQRLKVLQTGSFDPLKLLFYTEETNKINEDSIHLRFHHLRCKDNAEWFLATKEIIDFIEELKN